MKTYKVHFDRYIPITIEADSKKYLIEYAIEIMKCWGYAITKKMILKVELLKVVE